MSGRPGFLPPPGAASAYNPNLAFRPPPLYNTQPAGSSTPRTYLPPPSLNPSAVRAGPTPQQIQAYQFQLQAQQHAQNAIANNAYQSPSNATRASKKDKDKGPGPFSTSLKSMMYGFGDDPDPAEDSVAVMEDLFGHFVTELCTLPPLPASHPNPHKTRNVTSQALHHTLAAHPLSAPMLSRFEELTVLQKDIKIAKDHLSEYRDAGKIPKGAFKDDEGNLGKKRTVVPAGGLGGGGGPSKKRKAGEDGESGSVGRSMSQSVGPSGKKGSAKPKGAGKNS